MTTTAGATQDAAGRRGTAILVVDDDQRNVRLMESILRTGGYPVFKAYDGEEALRIVDAERPDLLLLDVMMPKMSGFEVCQRLKGRYDTRLLPIIMVTALNALEDKVQALEIGADDFLSKPINKVELLAKVRAVLRVKALQDEVEEQRRRVEAVNQELLRVQRFKESMTQMVVHDLKNPLAGIMGHIQLLQMQGSSLPAAKREEILERSQESARQLMRMILNILDIGRLEERRMPLRPEPLDLRRVAEDQMKDLQGLAARDNIRLECRVGDGLPPVEADRELLGRILGNLLNNAFKHTPGGGAVAVDAVREGGEIVLTVSDTGEGIPAELLPRIFDKFVSGDSEGGRRMLYDSGLGLTFCKLAIESHGGRIWVRSRPGEGTTVSLALPIKARPAGTAAADGGGAGGSVAA